MTLLVTIYSNVTKGTYKGQFVIKKMEDELLFDGKSSAYTRIEPW